MRARKWAVVALLSGLLLSLGSCATDFSYYLMSAVSDYLPDLLDAWLGTSTTTA
jgi:hypothetical protein